MGRSRASTFRAARVATLFTALFAGALLAPVAASAQFVRVTPDRTSLSLGETLSVQIAYQGSFDSSKGPDLQDFDLVGKSSGSSTSIVNGVMTQQNLVQLTLSPKRTGDLTIGAIVLLSGGKAIASSKPVRIRVGARGVPVPSGPPGEPPDEPPASNPSAESDPKPEEPVEMLPKRLAGQPYFLVVRGPDRPVYVGEPVWVAFDLYLREGVRLADAAIETAPDLRKFVARPVQGDVERGRRVRAGERGDVYTVRPLWQGTVSALESGPSVVGGMKVQLVVIDGFFSKRVSVTSVPLTLDFRPVPSEGRPADYVEGTVGRFVLKATLDRTSVPERDAALLTVEVSGTGNLQALKPPIVAALDGLRVSRVPSGDLDEVRVDVGGVSGRRSFQYLLVPDHVAEFDLGRVELPYFNGLTGKFERARSEPLRLVATARSGGPVREVRADPVVVLAAGRSLDAPVSGNRAGPPSALVMAGLAFPLLFAGGAEAVTRRRSWLARHGVGIARRTALKQALRSLDRLGAGTDSLESAAFWGGVEAVLREFLSTRFGMASAGMTWDEVRTFLIARGAERSLADVLVSEMESCAFGRFAPSAAQDKDRRASLARVRDCAVRLDRVRTDGGES